MFVVPTYMTIIMLCIVIFVINFCFQVNVAVIIVSQTANLDYETLPEYNLQLIAVDNPINLNNNNVQFKTSVPVSTKSLENTGTMCL